MNQTHWRIKIFTIKPKRKKNMKRSSLSFSLSLFHFQRKQNPYICVCVYNNIAFYYIFFFVAVIISLENLTINPLEHYNKSTTDWCSTCITHYIHSHAMPYSEYFFFLLFLWFYLTFNEISCIALYFIQYIIILYIQTQATDRA